MPGETPPAVSEDCLYLNIWTPAFSNAESRVQYLGDPITVGGVANIHGLSVFDAVYSTVRGKPFAAR